jgi:hypothetical protein
MGHRGLVLMPRCIGHRRVRTQTPFIHSAPKHILSPNIGSFKVNNTNQISLTEYDVVLVNFKSKEDTGIALEVPLKSYVKTRDRNLKIEYTQHLDISNGYGFLK